MNLPTSGGFNLPGNPLSSEAVSIAKALEPVERQAPVEPSEVAVGRRVVPVVVPQVLLRMHPVRTIVFPGLPEGLSRSP